MEKQKRFALIVNRLWCYILRVAISKRKHLKKKYFKKKPSKRKTLEKKLDILWSKAVKVIAGYRCEVCGRTGNRLNSHHFFGRRTKGTRWDEKNGFCLCAGCHILNASFSAHQTPSLFHEWAIKKRGEEWYESLKERFQEFKKHSIEELGEMYNAMSEVPKL